MHAQGVKLSLTIKPKVKLSATVRVKQVLRRYGLWSVCEESFCPNISECFGIRGTVTFLIMGKFCTRSCAYCSVPKMKNPPPPPPDEPDKIASAVKELGLKYVVLTSPDRDDLPDGGATHFARCVEKLKELCKVEVLVPDFFYRTELVDIVLDAKPDVFAHNIETVRKLYPVVRPKGSWEGALKILEHASARGFLTKSSLIVGLGESDADVKETISALANSGCQILTIGQYYRPTARHRQNFLVPSEKFQEWAFFARKMGIRYVFAGYNVRSSYLADEVWKDIFGGGGER